MSDIETIAGVFSINTCKLPESYICNKKPAVTYENGVFTAKIMLRATP